MGILLLAGGCAVPSARDNAASTVGLLEGKVPAPLSWRRDPEADRSARERAGQLLADGLTAQEAIAVAFLTNPRLQIAFEQLEVSRAELVAATRPANPVVILGSREPGGDLAAYYPDRTISVGVLQNVISLLTIPGRRAYATRNLERARNEVAQQAVEHAAQVTEAWYRYAAARRQLALQELSTNAIRSALEFLTAQSNANASADALISDRMQLYLAQASLERARLDASDERVRLEGLLGVAGWRDDWEITGELPRLPATDPDAAAVEAAAMEKRFDLRAAREAVEMRLRQLSTQRRFSWLSELEIGVFRDKAIGGTPFTGPTVAFEFPLFDQRQAAVLEADAQLRTAVRQLEALALEARGQIRRNVRAMAAMRQLVERYERDILPGHERIAANLGPGDPGEVGRQNVRLGLLAAQREHTSVLRDYWVARSALAHAGGDWLALSGTQ